MPPLPQASKRALRKTQRRPAGRPTPPPALQPLSPLFIRLSPPLSAQPDTIEEDDKDEDEDEDNRKENNKDNKDNKDDEDNKDNKDKEEQEEKEQEEED